jgi:hypothetical protein
MGIEKLTVEEVHELRKEGEVEVEVETADASASRGPRKKKRGS